MEANTLPDFQNRLRDDTLALFANSGVEIRDIALSSFSVWIYFVNNAKEPRKIKLSFGPRFMDHVAEAVQVIKQEQQTS